MSTLRIVVLTLLAMIAFAGNSLLGRLALAHTSIDAATYTTVRMASGALMLWLCARAGGAARVDVGSWLSALALMGYAAAFSFAYRSLPTAVGALILFGAVQATMIGHGLYLGERLQRWQWFGLLLAMVGLIGLMLPGLSAPPLVGSLLMLIAGVAWGIYSLRGRGAGDPIRVSAGNFLRAVPIALLLSAATWPHAVFDRTGIAYAIASGALSSGIGYTIWYSVLPALRATTASTVQLSVPLIAAVGGALFMDEQVGLRLLLAGIAIIGGIALVISARRRG